MMMIGILPTLTEQHLNARGASAPTRATSCSTSRSSPPAARTSTSASPASSGSRRSPTRSRPRPRARACSCTSRSTRTTFARALERGAGDRRRAARGRRATRRSSSARELWRETRIALFEQATDTRPEELKAQGVRPRVWFGERWITSIFDLFEENVRYFPALLPVCEDEDPVEVLEARRHPAAAGAAAAQRHVYRWNRPIYDVVRGRPHLRVENRVLPAGPTVVDIARQRRLLLRARARAGRRRTARSGRRCRSRPPRRTSTRARATGIDARVYWPGRRRGAGDRARAAPAAADGPRGARRAGASTPADRDRLLGIIERRCVDAAQRRLLAGRDVPPALRGRRSTAPTRCAR